MTDGEGGLPPTPGTPAPAPPPGASPGAGARPWKPTPVEPRRAPARPGAWLGVLLGVVALGSCAVGGAVLFGALGAVGGGGAGPGGRIVAREVSGSGKDRIAVVPVRGMIASGGGMAFSAVVTEQEVRDCLKQAAEDSSVRAVVLEVESPGGEVTACDLIHGDVKRMRTEARKPVVAYLEGVAASGGYYISAPADKIIAYPTTVTGSIGVILQFLNLSGAAEKLGVSRVTVASGAHKDVGDMFRPFTEEDRKIFQPLVEDMHERFVDVVTSGRERAGLTRDEAAALADGRPMTATAAQSAKLVDRLGTFDDAVAEARRLAGVSEATVIRYGRVSLFGGLLGARAPETPTASAALAALQGLATPRAFYLFTR